MKILNFKTLSAGLFTTRVHGRETLAVSSLVFKGFPKLLLLSVLLSLPGASKGGDFGGLSPPPFQVNHTRKSSPKCCEIRDEREVLAPALIFPVDATGHCCCCYCRHCHCSGIFQGTSKVGYRTYAWHRLKIVMVLVSNPTLFLASGSFLMSQMHQIGLHTVIQTRVVHCAIPFQPVY